MALFPASIPQVYEYQPFSSVHFFDTSVTVTGYTITTSANPCSSSFAANVTVSSVGTTSIVVSGFYQDIFIDTRYQNRDIKLNDTLTEYQNLPGMPDPYWSAVKFTADPRDTVLVNVNILTTAGVQTLTQVVRNNLSYRRNKLLDWVYDATVNEKDIKPSDALPDFPAVISNLSVVSVTSVTFPSPTVVNTTTSGTFVVPAGVISITVSALGGGGGGGSGNENNGEHGGGGGGGGGYQVTNLAVTPGQVISWQVGGGGARMGQIYTGFGDNGGDTFFGTVISTGGGGGQGVTNNANNGIGGFGGAGGIPNGISAGNGTFANGSAFGGVGGNSPAGPGTVAPLGTGGPGGVNSNGAAGYGQPATGFGAGGGGGGARDVTGTPAPTFGGDGAPGWLQISYGVIA